MMTTELNSGNYKAHHKLRCQNCQLFSQIQLPQPWLSVVCCFQREA